MKWKQLLFTIVLNIFLMLAVSIMLEYSDLTERFSSLENTIQEALDMSIQASVNSEEFFTEKYQNMLMSHAGLGNTNEDMTTAAMTLIWLKDAEEFVQVNTYQYAKWYEGTGRLPATIAEVNAINNVGTGNSAPFGLSGYIFSWLYGGVGSDYLSGSLQYANRNSSRRAEYSLETAMEPRSNFNANFREYYEHVGNLQLTAGYLKKQVAGAITSYSLELLRYPVLYNMGLSWMEAPSGSGIGNYTKADSTITADNLCSSLHIGKSYWGSTKTYYFLTPASLGVTYIPTEVLKPVMVANLDTFVRLNMLGGAQRGMNDLSAKTILGQASNCISTDVYDFNAATAAYTGNADFISNVDADGHTLHIPSSLTETIVTDGLVEYDLDTLQIKVDYFYWNFNDPAKRDQSALLISKLNGTLSRDGVSGAATTEADLRRATLTAFLNQDTSQYVSSFNSQNLYSNAYEDIKDCRIIARVTAKIKVHVPYKSSILQWAAYMFTGTHHFDIKLFNPASGMTVGNASDGIWYQYTTFYCTSRT